MTTFSRSQGIHVCIRHIGHGANVSNFRSSNSAGMPLMDSENPTAFVSAEAVAG